MKTVFIFAAYRTYAYPAAVGWFLFFVELIIVHQTANTGWALDAAQPVQNISSSRTAVNITAVLVIRN